LALRLLPGSLCSSLQKACVGPLVGAVRGLRGFAVTLCALRPGRGTSRAPLLPLTREGGGCCSVALRLAGRLLGRARARGAGRLRSTGTRLNAVASRLAGITRLIAAVASAVGCRPPAGAGLRAGTSRLRRSRAVALSGACLLLSSR